LGEELDEVLFALSSGDRMKLFSEIKAEELRLTDLSKHLSASIQETSKHLARLTACGLVEKTTGGTYALTPFGKLAGEVLPSLAFICVHRRYFLAHDISFLPRDLLLKIGQLSESKFQDHVTNVILDCQHVLGMAEQYFCWSTDLPLPWHNTRKLGPEVPVRILLPASTTLAAVEKAREIVGARPEFRFAEDLRAGIALNERIAAIVFSDMEGRVDLRSGFIGYGQSFQRWCLELFNTLWESASPLWPAKLVEEELSGPAASSSQ
jgi:predicted transcriptional regulator